jgi:hypothetical protein
VAAGATAWDKEDGDISKRVLSCPPVSCMPFNCPGHDFFRKGLSGCGIDTLNAPVGTEFALAFTVSDLSIPPATSEVLRRIIVVSPCKPGQTYCPELAGPALSTDEFACGKTDCISRAAILAQQPVQPTRAPPSARFSTALPVSAISNRSAGQSQISGSLHGQREKIFSPVRFLLHTTFLDALFSALLLTGKVRRR